MPPPNWAKNEENPEAQRHIDLTDATKMELRIRQKAANALAMSYQTKFMQQLPEAANEVVEASQRS